MFLYAKTIRKDCINLLWSTGLVLPPFYDNSHGEQNVRLKMSAFSHSRIACANKQ